MSGSLPGQTRGMQEIDLNEQEQRVLSAVSDLESRDAPTYVPEIARAAGLGEDAVREALTALTGRHNLISEVGPGADIDLGVTYTVRTP